MRVLNIVTLIFFLSSNSVYAKILKPNKKIKPVEVVKGFKNDTDEDQKRFIQAKFKYGSEEIIVIAPYNRQVQRLRKKLGKKAEISTVDKFQGREAAVAIFSLTSSTGNDAPRGLNFLLEPNRLNVAISRAKCLSIIVGSEDLLSSSVNSIDDAKLLNNICKINSENRKA